MANTYKNAAVVLTSTGATDLYTCPSGRTAIVQSVNVANVDSSNRDVTVTLYDSSAATSYTVIYNATIPVGVSMNALSTPLVLEPGDIVRVQASAANTLHATASVMEQDATSIHVDGSITTAKIADDAVTVDKLASSLSATTICTSSTRPTSPFEGQKIYETDTDRELTYDSSAWVQTVELGAWTSYTPALINCTLGSGQLNCVYNKIGRQVTCRIMFQYGSTTSITGPLNIELPFTGASWGAGYHTFSSTATLSSGTTRYLCIPWSSNLTYVRFTAFGGSGTAVNTGDVTGTFPKTLVNGDQINTTFTYEAA